VVDIFTEEIVNTRFILTVLAVSLFALFGVAILIIIVMMPGVKISEGLMGLLTTLLGAVIAIVSVAYNSHFKAQEDAATARVVAQKDAATARVVAQKDAATARVVAQKDAATASETAAAAIR
jgi:hypothetical protein